MSLLRTETVARHKDCVTPRDGSQTENDSASAKLRNIRYRDRRRGGRVQLSYELSSKQLESP